MNLRRKLNRVREVTQEIRGVNPIRTVTVDANITHTYHLDLSTGMPCIPYPFHWLVMEYPEDARTLYSVQLVYEVKRGNTFSWGSSYSFVGSPTGYLADRVYAEMIYPRRKEIIKYASGYGDGRFFSLYRPWGASSLLPLVGP